MIWRKPRFHLFDFQKLLLAHLSMGLGRKQGPSSQSGCGCFSPTASLEMCSVEASQRP